MRPQLFQALFYFSFVAEESGRNKQDFFPLKKFSTIFNQSII